MVTGVSERRGLALSAPELAGATDRAPWIRGVTESRRRESGALVIEQGVALTGRNRTGPPWSVGRPTAHAPGAGASTADAPGGRPARPPAALQTSTDTSDRY